MRACARLHVAWQSALLHAVPGLPFCSRNELLGEVDIDLMEEVQSAPGGDVTKTWRLQNLATDWIAAMGARGERTGSLAGPRAG